MSYFGRQSQNQVDEDDDDADEFSFKSGDSQKKQVELKKTDSQTPKITHVHVELGDKDRTMKFISSDGLKSKL